MGFRDEYSKFAGLMLDYHYQSRALDMETDFTEDGQVGVLDIAPYGTICSVLILKELVAFLSKRCADCSDCYV